MRSTRASLLVPTVAAALVITASPARASGGPPVTQPDAVTVRIDSRAAHLDLGANDTDPDGDPLVFAGVDQPVPGIGIVDNSKTGGRQDVLVFASTLPRPGDAAPVAPGTYVVKTYISDGSNLAASTLAITVLPALKDSVTLTPRKRPGRAVVHN